MPDLKFEYLHGRGSNLKLCGVDEVGRGPLAGPVVAAACLWPLSPIGDRLEKEINDSKKLSAAKREKLYLPLQERCVYAIASASVEEIDRLNILQASLLAMHRAILALPCIPDHALIDGNKIPVQLPCTATAIIGGDGLSLSIAAASIIAKVYRDRLMRTYSEQFPQYGFERNAGYGTAEHMAAIKMWGVTSLHRQSFAPIRAAM